MTTTTPAHPVDILMDEHRVIEGMLSALERRLAKLDQEPLPYEFLTDALEFFRHFADGCHHAKEEEMLFPVMEQRGIPRQYGPIGCMLKEHTQGREYVNAMLANLGAARDGSADARAALLEAGTCYIAMLRQHIQKEDQILFQMAIRALTEQDREALLAGFLDPANARIGAEVRGRYMQLAARLCEESRAIV